MNANVFLNFYRKIKYPGNIFFLKTSYETGKAELIMNIFSDLFSELYINKEMYETT